MTGNPTGDTYSSLLSTFLKTSTKNQESEDFLTTQQMTIVNKSSIGLSCHA